MPYDDSNDDRASTVARPNNEADGKAFRQALLTKLVKVIKDLHQTDGRFAEGFRDRDGSIRTATGLTDAESGNRQWLLTLELTPRKPKDKEPDPLFKLNVAPVAEQDAAQPTQPGGAEADTASTDQGAAGEDSDVRTFRLALLVKLVKVIKDLHQTDGRFAEGFRDRDGSTGTATGLTDVESGNRQWLLTLELTPRKPEDKDPAPFFKLSIAPVAEQDAAQPTQPGGAEADTASTDQDEIQEDDNQSEADPKSEMSKPAPLDIPVTVQDEIQKDSKRPEAGASPRVLSLSLANVFSLLAASLSAAVLLMILLKPPPTSAPTPPPPDHRAELEQLSRDVKSVKSIATEMERLDALSKEVDAKTKEFDKAAGTLNKAAGVFKSNSDALLTGVRGVVAQSAPPDVLIVITHGSTFDANRYKDVINNVLAIRGPGVGRVGVAVASTQQLAVKVKMDEPKALVDTFHKVVDTDSEAPSRIGEQVREQFTDENRPKRKVVLIVSTKCDPLTRDAAGWQSIPSVDVIVVPSPLGEVGQVDWKRLSEWHGFINGRLATGRSGGVRWLVNPDPKQQDALLRSCLEDAIRPVR